MTKMASCMRVWLSRLWSGLRAFNTIGLETGVAVIGEVHEGPGKARPDQAGEKGPVADQRTEALPERLMHLDGRIGDPTFAALAAVHLSECVAASPKGRAGRWREDSGAFPPCAGAARRRTSREPRRRRAECAR